jgi:site-specific recombinase XerD
MTKAIHVEPIVIEFSEDPKFTQFLNSQKATTRKTYASYLRQLNEFTNNESGTQMLKESKDWKRRLFEFRQYLLTKKYSSNYTESCTGMVRGFFAFFDKPLQFNRTERIKLRKRSRTTNDFSFDQTALAKMRLVGTVRTRAYLSLGKAFGLRAEDFTNKLNLGMLRRLDLTQESPIFVGKISTCKEDCPAFLYLDKDAITDLKPFLEEMKSKPDSTRIWKARKEDLSKMLQRLAAKAEIDAHGDKIRWHGLRAFLFNSLCRVVSTEKAKQIIGKTLSESAYLNDKDLLEDYARVMPLIAYDTNHIKEKVNALSQSLTEKDALIREQQIEINTLKMKLSENNSTMSKLLDLPTIKAEMLKAREKVQID